MNDEAFKTLPLVNLFQGAAIDQFDLYWIVYEPPRMSRRQKSELKNVGWRLQRHSRTNREMWVFDK